MRPDPFGTARLRDAVLDAWRASSARFREDANTEEDYARGFYRDRVLIDLAQNGADAAARSGRPGRLLVRLEPDGDATRLVVANTGTPLDAAGVAALASMRASAKRDDRTQPGGDQDEPARPAEPVGGSEEHPVPSGGRDERACPAEPVGGVDERCEEGPGLVGRFGVGFAAVRAVADEIEVRSTTGTMRFSLAATRALLADVTGPLADEVARRGDQLPVLRLPLPGTGGPRPGPTRSWGEPARPADLIEGADGRGEEHTRSGGEQGEPVRRTEPVEGADGRGEEYDTTVVAWLRDDDAVAAVRVQLGDVADPLLLALPALAEIVVEQADRDGRVDTRRVADVADRWRVRTATGTLDVALLADRPVEERHRTGWRVTWALPRTDPRCPSPSPSASSTGSVEHARSLCSPLDRVWPRVVHAPTPTDDPCSLPALLVATLPLDPTRRHVVPGPAADAVLAQAADAYAALATEAVADGDDVSTLVPTGLAAGELDARLRELVVAALRRVPVLPGPDGLVAPERAVALAAPAGHVPELVAALACWVPGLVGVPLGGAAALRALDVPGRSLSEVIGALSVGPTLSGASVGMHDDRARPHLPPTLAPDEDGAGGAPSDRRRSSPGSSAASLGSPLDRLYDAVGAVLPEQAEELAALPVLLADGRAVRGARGSVVLDDALADRLSPATVATLGRWGVRLVDPAHAHPVLERLGAAALDVPGLLASPQVREAIVNRQDDPDGDDPAGDGLGEVARAVVELVGLDQDLRGTADLPGPGQGPAVLGMVELPAEDGEPIPAHGLVLPGSLAHRLFDDRVMAPVSAAAIDQVTEPVLRALGVRSAPVAVRVPDVIADPGADDPEGTDDATLLALSLDGWDDYLAWLADRLGPGAWVGDVRCVADLDAVAADAWPAMLAAVVGDRDLRTALLDPVRTPGGSAASYSAWWLTHRAGLGLGAPFALHPDVLPGWLPGPPAVLAEADDEVRRALGGVGGPDELGLPGWAQVLDACQVGEPVDLPRAVEVWRALAALAQPRGTPGALRPDDPPRVLPALVGPARAALVRTESVVVADAPMWSQRTDLGAVLPVPSAAAAALAGLFAVPLAAELAPGQVDGPGETEPVPDQVLALAGAVTSWQVHDELTVDGADVDWWVDADGTVHAVHLAGLAAALAQANDRWPDRWAIEAALADPARAPEAQLDQAFTV